MSAVDGRERWTTLHRSFAKNTPTGKLAATVPAVPDKASTAMKSSRVLVDEYISHSTVHGMRYITKASLIEK